MFQNSPKVSLFLSSFPLPRFDERPKSDRTAGVVFLEILAPGIDRERIKNKTTPLFTATSI